MASSSLKERFQESVTSDALRSYLAEFISTFFFVFAAVGSSMASRKLAPDIADPTNLVAVAVATTFALSFSVYISANISGGHVNPAVTFSMAIGGHISAPTAMFYWISQLFGSITACLFLKVTTVNQRVPAYNIAQPMTGFGASIIEGVLTFGLVYTVYAAGDTKRGSTLGGIGPLVIGLFAGASVLVAGPYSGGVLNPASAFGSAVLAGKFGNQAVYWVGPLIGAALAGLLYDNVMDPASIGRISDSVIGI